MDTALVLPHRRRSSNKSSSLSFGGRHTSVERLGHWQQAEEEPPAYGLIENTDGRPISVKQFMEAVHDYAVPLRRLLCQSCYIWSKDEERAKFYLTYLVVYRSSPEDQTPSATMDVIEDTGTQGQNILADRLQETESRYRGRLESK
jgi:hypothetical protein